MLEEIESIISEMAEWTSLDLLLVIFWFVFTCGIMFNGLVTLFIDSPSVPAFLRTLLLYGKFGKEPKLIAGVDGGGGQSGHEPKTFGSLLFGMIDSIVRRLEVPKSWFKHFYVYLLVIWIVVITAVTFTYTPGHSWTDDVQNYLLLGALLIQSCRRIYETNFVSIYSDNTINVAHYLTGYLFYTTLGYATYCSVQPNYPRWHGHIMYPDSGAAFSTLGFFFVLFLVASYVQYSSHVTLAALRLDKKDEGDARGYYIPRGGLFNLVACPHYLAEIVIYFCLWQFSTPVDVAATAHHLLWPVLVGFVVANQLVASLVTHRWYRVKFGDRYPGHIKAIIPFVL